MNFYSVEKIEGQIGVLELPDKSFKEFLLSDLPEGLKEGDLLYKSEDGFVIDKAATLERRKKLYKMQKNLFNNENN